MNFFTEDLKLHIVLNNKDCHPSSIERLNFRYSHFIENISYKFKNASVLDIGCHNGEFCYAAKKLGASKVVGIDCEKEYIDYAKKNVFGVDFICGDFFDFQSEKFDIVLCLGVLYFYDPLKLLIFCKKMTKKIMILDTFVGKYLDQNNFIGTVESKKDLEKLLDIAGFYFKELPVMENSISIYKTKLKCSYWCFPKIPSC